MLNIDVDLRCTHTAELINSQAKIEKTGVRPLIAENRGQTPFLAEAELAIRPRSSSEKLGIPLDRQTKNRGQTIYSSMEKSGLTPILGEKWSDPDFWMTPIFGKVV